MSPPRRAGRALDAVPARMRTRARLAAALRAVTTGVVAAGLVSQVHAQEPSGAPRGSDIFDSACAHCHGVNGRGTALAPSILQRIADTAEDDALAAFLRVGVPERGMPPAPVTGDEMTTLVAYLRFLGSAAGAAAVEASEDGARAIRSTIDSFPLVTEEVLQAPADSDWLWFGRSRDGRAYSPLDDMNAENVRQLRLAWSRGLPAGGLQAMPIVYAGIMYVAMPDSSIAALDAATGDAFWQSSLDDASAAETGSRSGTLSIFGDTLYFTPTAGTPVALDARTGERRVEGAAAAAPSPRPSDAAATASSEPLATGGGLLFRLGDDRRFRALDAETGDSLWQTILGGPVSTSVFSYAVDGRQHVAVLVGGAGSSANARDAAADSASSPGALYVFALLDDGEQDDR